MLSACVVPDENPEDDLGTTSQFLDRAFYEVTRGSCRTTARVNIKGRLQRAPDLDRDGRTDLAIVKDVTQADGTLTSILSIHSRMTGAQLYRWTAPGFIYSTSLVQSLDRDRVQELAIATQKQNPDFCTPDGCASRPPDPLRLHALSLARQRVLWSTRGILQDPSFGAAVATLDEANGRTALLVGSPFPMPGGSSGRVSILDGRDGGSSAPVPTPAGATASFGAKVRSLGDVDHDGVADFVVSDPLGPEDQFGAGRVTAFSGGDKHVLWEVLGAITGEDEDPSLLGDELDVPGDLDGDGTADVVIGAHGFTGDLPLQGKVVAVNGRTGAILWTARGRRGFEQLGTSIVTVGDLDHDGVNDIGVAATSPPAPVVVLGQGGRFAVLSGRTGELLVEIVSRVGPEEPSDIFGSHVTTSSATRGAPAIAIGTRTGTEVLTCRP
jgi:hypothetical protein